MTAYLPGFPLVTSTEVVCENHRAVLSTRTLARKGERRSQIRPSFLC